MFLEFYQVAAFQLLLYRLVKEEYIYETFSGTLYSCNCCAFASVTKGLVKGYRT